MGGATVSLSACTGDPGPVASVTPKPTPSAGVVVSETPSVSPSPAALSDEELLALIPEDARAENFGSAVNFASFFVREYQRMFLEHDSALFAFVSGDTCGFCASALQSFAEDEAVGNTVAGGDITPDYIQARGGLQDDGTWLVQFSMDVEEAKYFNSDGTLRTTEAAAAFNVGVLLEREQDHWTVAGLNLESAN